MIMIILGYLCVRGGVGGGAGGGGGGVGRHKGVVFNTSIYGGGAANHQIITVAYFQKLFFGF